MKVRLRFSKLGRLRWTSHRDVARVWERTMRRAGLPLAYTAGFSPRPQLSFGLALPTGCESVAEYLDAALRDDVDAEALPGRLDPLLPEGMAVLAAAVLEPGTGSLQQDVTSCTWDIELPEVAPALLDDAVQRALGAASLPVNRSRKGRQEIDDLRPSILVLTALEAGDGGSRLFAELATRPRGVRPSELGEALGLPLGPARRTCQWIERDGSRWEPLTAGAASTALAAGRAS
ncbi:MAG: TIGR03936 family radical SAM-associated protein [Acidimicrobiales bacterium]